MGEKLPALTGRQLIELFKQDGWVEVRRTTHGVSLRKAVAGRTRLAVIPDKPGTLPETVLGRIISTKQSGMGRRRLSELVDRYGLS